MALQKQDITINFGQGLDLKTQSKDIPVGKFLSLENSVFNKGGQLQKRNGFAEITTLANANYLSTFAGNLLGLSLNDSGTQLSAYSQGNNTWTSKGTVILNELSVQSVVKNNTVQTQCDMAIATNGLACTVFTETGGSTSPNYKYVVTDTSTGQNLLPDTALAGTSGTVTGSPKVFVLGSFFFIIFPVTISATVHLQYIAISSVSLIVHSAVDISSTFAYDSRGSFDAFVANNSLYLVYNATSTSVKMTYFDSTLTQHNTVTYASQVANVISVTADLTTPNPIIYVSWSNIGGSVIITLATDNALNPIFVPTTVLTSVTICNITSTASNGVCTVTYEVVNAYTYDSSVPTHYVARLFVYQAGTFSGPTTQMRGVGLASKQFLLSKALDAHAYVLVAYKSTYQSTNFLMQVSNQFDVSAVNFGMPISILAYQNGSGYLTTGLPNANVTSSNSVTIPYLYQQSIATINKSNGATVGNVAGIYAQLGVNSVTYNFEPVTSTYEIGNNLHLTGGYIAAYDGYGVTEQGFFLYPDSVEVTTATGSGALTAQQYFYQAVYEWSDNQGNLHQSAPSIPVAVTTTTSSSTNTIYVPTLRTTYKISNPVKICLYRYSAAQQTYYQVTSVTSPKLNDLTVDYVTITDALADSSILGNAILYTTGGVVEDIGPPASSIMALYGSRLFLVQAESPNTLWYSKQVLQDTPVEFSDLFTIYIAPTTAAEGSTGPITALYPMDGNLIIFKRDAIYFINGTGPDNTGANNDFSPPVFITSNVGCTNAASIVLTPNGLMFQSDKGIWLLERNLQTSYIGAPVEDFNSFTVTSATNIPGTNQIRFTLAGTNTFLMYDTYYGQWGTFVGLTALNSVLYQNLHTFVDPYNRIFQESVGQYLDASVPVTMQFTTGWLHLAGLQGYQRAYYFYLLGEYITPYTLTMSIAYDYQTGAKQISTINPTNYSPPYGGDSLYGGGDVYGGSQPIAQNRIFLDLQKCQSIQISMKENYDSSIGAAAGAGLTLSGLTLILGAKNIHPMLSASQSVGSNQ